MAAKKKTAHKVSKGTEAALKAWETRRLNAKLAAKPQKSTRKKP